MNHFHAASLHRKLSNIKLLGYQVAARYTLAPILHDGILLDGRISLSQALKLHRSHQTHAALFKCYTCMFIISL